MASKIHKAYQWVTAASEAVKYLHEAEAAFLKAREATTRLPEDGDQEALLLDVSERLECLRKEAEGDLKDYSAEYNRLVEQASREEPL